MVTIATDKRWRQLYHSILNQIDSKIHVVLNQAESKIHAVLNPTDSLIHFVLKQTDSTTHVVLKQSDFNLHGDRLQRLVPILGEAIQRHWCRWPRLKKGTPPRSVHRRMAELSAMVGSIIEAISWVPGERNLGGFGYNVA